MRKRIFYNYSWLIIIYISAIFIFTIFRFVLFYLQSDAIGIEDKTNVLPAFVMGLRFDTVISCYILALPLLLLTIASLFQKFLKICRYIVTIWVSLLFSLTFFLSAANIPYYLQFNRVIDASVMNWLDEPEFVISMILQEKSFIVYLILFIIALVIFIYWVAFLQKRVLKTDSYKDNIAKYYITLPIFLLLASLCFFGLRGRVEIKSPIRLGTAYFCTNPFLNQLGLNPSFVFIKSISAIKKAESSKIRMMDNDAAISLVSKDLGLEDSTPEALFRREVTPQNNVLKKNVVVILMESMSSKYVENKEITPFINSLINKSEYYPNTYSAGIHTMNGLAATIFSEQALMLQHPFKLNQIRTHQSIASELKKIGYSTSYFTTHDDQFDNVGGYLYANGFERIYSKKDYPKNRILSEALGCADDYLFEYGVEKLSSVAESGQPFLGVFLTISNHQPYILPDYYTPKAKGATEKMVEYSDWSLRKFFEMAEKTDWYNNTLFVLLGDHGCALDGLDVSLSYHTIPLILFDGEGIIPSVNKTLVSQIDVFPTIMGYLNIPWCNETLGEDIRTRPREYVCFTSDNAYCCIDSAYYYVSRNSGVKTLYELSEKKDVISSHKDKSIYMDSLSRAYLQVGQIIIDNNMVDTSK